MIQFVSATYVMGNPEELHTYSCGSYNLQRLLLYRCVAKVILVSSKVVWWRICLRDGVTRIWSKFAEPT